MKGRVVANIAKLMQLFQAFNVRVLRTDAADLHQSFPVKREWVLEPVAVPVMKQSQVKADVTGREAAIPLEQPKESVQVMYVVHDCLVVIIV